MKREEVDNVDPLIEMLARMKCRNSLIDEEEIITLYVDDVPENQPQWKWFIPRAQGDVDSLLENGYVIRRIDR